MPAIRTITAEMPGQDGRRERFERIFADSYRPVRAYVIRRAPAGAVEDVLSEVFLVAWRRLDSIAADPLPWPFGVARRVLANQRRAERRRGALLDRPRLGAGFDDPGWQAPRGLRSELAAAVAPLSATEREALLLVARPTASEFFDPQGGPMTTDDPVLRELSDADPAIGHTDADAGEAERVLRAALSDGAPRPRGSRPPRRAWLTAALGAVSVLVVAAVVVIAVGAGHRGGSSAAPGAGRRAPGTRSRSSTGCNRRRRRRR